MFMANNRCDSVEDIMDIDDSISASKPLSESRSIGPDVFQCKNLRDAIIFILNNNPQQRNNEILTEHQEQIFEIIEKLRLSPQTMFMYLREHFAKHFDIGLYIIAFDNEKFSLIHENNYNKKKMAFLLFNEDNTVCGPLYTINECGANETVFNVVDFNILLDVNIYVARLNDKNLPNDFPQIQEQQAVSCEQESIENLANQLNPYYSVQVGDKTQSRASLVKLLQQIYRLFDNLPISPDAINQACEPFLSHITTFEHLSPEDTILALKDGDNCLSYVIQMVESLIHINRNNQVTLPDVDIPSESVLPNDVPTTVTDTNNSTTEQLIEYISPALRKPLKSTIHPRTLKEFAKTGSSPVQCINSKQREPLRIRVPPDDKNLLYLGIGIITDDDDNLIHPSKILVPDKTKASGEMLINNNDLGCLNCDGCHSGDKFDLDKKHIYSKISSTERQALQKEIRIHMLNLYQRNTINRKMVQDQHLKKFKLALWFCIYKNGVFKSVSQVYHSNIVEESMKVTNTTKKVVVKKRK